MTRCGEEVHIDAADRVDRRTRSSTRPCRRSPEARRHPGPVRSTGRPPPGRLSRRTRPPWPCPRSSRRRSRRRRGSGWPASACPPGSIRPPSGPTPPPRPAHDAPGCPGTGRRACARRRRALPRAWPGPVPRPSSRARTRCPRSVNRSRIASDVAGDGGIGMPNGITTWIARRRARRDPRRYASSNMAASLGAGGHLNGAPHTPTIASPAEKDGRMSRTDSAPGSE